MAPLRSLVYRLTTAATLLALAAAPASADRAFIGSGLAPSTEIQRGSLDAKTILEKVGYDQHLGASIPLDLPFRDENGQAVRLGDTFGSKPVLLALVYFRCPMLCTQIAIGTAAGLKGIDYLPGKDFEVLFVSFDPRDTPEGAREKKASTVARYGRPETAAGWHFLTGDAAAIARLTESVGFRYAWDPKVEQFAHASGVVVLTPDGRLARYLYGVEYAPKDLQLALHEASDGRIGGLAESLLLLCFHYDAALGKYTIATQRALKVGATLTLVVLAGSIVWMLRRERRLKRAPAGGLA